jgi:hypothetical protein
VWAFLRAALRAASDDPECASKLACIRKSLGFCKKLSKKTAMNTTKTLSKTKKNQSGSLFTPRIGGSVSESLIFSSLPYF